MIGHGHVRPNPNGLKARCGGPGFCRECDREFVEHKNKNDFGFLTSLYNYVGPEVIESTKRRAKMLHTKEVIEIRAELEGCLVRIQVISDETKNKTILRKKK